MKRIGDKGSAQRHDDGETRVLRRRNETRLPLTR